MRILIVTQYFWPESCRINDLALGLKQRGHEVEVLTGVPNYPEGRFSPGYGALSPSQERFEPKTVDELIKWLEDQKKTLKNERKQLSEQYSTRFFINKRKPSGAVMAAVLNAI